MASPPKLDVRIWRGGDAGGFVAYEAPAADNRTVLDVVTWIQRHLERALRGLGYAARADARRRLPVTLDNREGSDHPRSTPYFSPRTVQGSRTTSLSA